MRSNLNISIQKAIPQEKRNIAHEILWNLNMKDKNIVDYQLRSPYNSIANLPKTANFHAKLRDLESNQNFSLQRRTSYR